MSFIHMQDWIRSDSVVISYVSAKPAEKTRYHGWVLAFPGKAIAPVINRANFSLVGHKKSCPNARADRQGDTHYPPECPSANWFQRQ